jgi:hypothetical protein
VVAFDAEAVQRFLDQGPASTARLMLTYTEDGNPSSGKPRWRRHAPLVVAYPLSDAFEEGSGNSFEGDRGAGAGATWNCAIEAEISDGEEDCLLDWTERRRFGGPRHERPVLSSREGLGPIVFDVGDHVLSGVSAWVIELFHSRPQRGSLAYISREGADALGDLGLAPALVLTRASDG